MAATVPSLAQVGVHAGIGDGYVGRMEAGRLTFIGNATTLLRLGSFTLLTDPNFIRAGQRAYLGYGLFSKRRRHPAMGVEDLPDLDTVLLSHLHGDHWDGVAERGLPRETPVVTTPAAAEALAKKGFATHGLKTWEPHELQRGDETLRITSLPGRHGPRGVNHLLPPVMGSLVDLERADRRELRLYISGDTLCVPELREIVSRFSDIDVAVVHLGGTRLLRLVLVTMDGKQGSDLVQLVNPGMVVPVHYDDYTVFTSPLSDFEAEAQRRGFEKLVNVVGRGEEIPLRGSAG